MSLYKCEMRVKVFLETVKLYRNAFSKLNIIAAEGVKFTM